MNFVYLHHQTKAKHFKSHNMKTLNEKLTELIEAMDNSELMSLNNAYCQSANYSDDEIYENNEEFFNMFFENNVMDAVRAVAFGDYSYGHDFVKFNGYGNLESMSVLDTSDLVDSLPAIIEYIIEHQDEFDMFDFDDLNEEIEN